MFRGRHLEGVWCARRGGERRGVGRREGVGVERGVRIDGGFVRAEALVRKSCVGSCSVACASWVVVVEKRVVVVEEKVVVVEGGW